jgi:hypothetical protein
MNPHTHHGESLVDHFLWRASMIHRKVRESGALQVRWHEGRLITFRCPAPRGYGVRGQLVAVYTDAARLDWIEDDLVAFARGLSEGCALISARPLAPSCIP